MMSSYRTLTRCLVCGFSEVRTDEVIDRGLVFLSECPRCLHRWTRREARLRTVVTTVGFDRAGEMPSAA